MADEIGTDSRGGEELGRGSHLAAERIISDQPFLALRNVSADPNSPARQLIAGLRLSPANV